MYYYVVNPAAGHGQIKTLQDKLRGRLEQLGINGEWVRTSNPGEATKLAANAATAGHTTIVAVGGDDTVNEVINGLTGHDQVAVGIIPLGSNNRLATQLGINGWPAACEILAARRLTPYPLIAAGQKFFLSTLTLGFETDLDKQLDAPPTGLQGRLSQLWAGWRHAQRFHTLACRITVDDQFRLRGQAFSMTITNQRFFHPTANNELIVAISDRPVQHLQLGTYLWQLLTRRSDAITEDVATTRFPARRVVIETDPVTGIMVDGKVAGRTPIAIRLTDRHVRFITSKVSGDFKEALGLVRKTLT